MSAPLSAAALRRKSRIDALTGIAFPAELPVVARREDLARAIRDNQVVIVCGETGSGKTTQLPKICLTLGRGVLGAIGHTQPRRVAARTVANRIAAELKTELGGLVGYKVRFHDKVSADTVIKLMTDGILLAEIHSDPLLRRYDTIIIDEAHERSLNIDFLLGYLKQLLPKRRDLKLIITSATLDADRFAKHFGAVVVEVSGRSYPVETRYRPLQISDEGEAQDVPKAVSAALDELAAGGLRGDVLVFLPGEREIRDTAEALRRHHPKGIEILPLFSRLSASEQDKVFKTGHGRRVVLATNVAETSLTVPNIGYVIDCGLARVNRYSIRQKVEQLHIEKISRAAANQRSGRCGRVMSGICIRLYDEADFLLRNEFTDPEIFRVSLATVILRMSALELGEIGEFPFIEPPTPRMIADGYQLLSELNAIDDERNLTKLGHELAKLPLDPKISRLLLAGRQYQCLTEILIIASALSVQDPRERPLDRQEAADAAHKRFADERSDFLAFIKMWAWFEQALAHKQSNRLFSEECRKNFLSPLRLREWRELYQQLHTQVTEMGMRENELPASYEQIHKALLCGLLGNIGMKGVEGNEYMGARGIKFFIAPNSVLAKKGAKWVMAGELIETHRLYARCVARIEAEWLEEVGDHLIKRHYYDPHWEKKPAQVVAFERSTLHGLLLNAKKRVHYGPMNVPESREVFIRQALVEGEFDTRAPFFAFNQKLIAEIEALEHKARRPDVLVDDELIFAFYDSRIAPHIHNGATFESWRKEAERTDAKLLYLKKDDLMRHEAAGITTDQFPPQMKIDNVSFALSYNFSPGKNDDGITFTVPLALINQVTAARCEWLIPGLLPEKIVQLVKTLPQKIRRNLVPVPEFAARFVRDVPPANLSLLLALARYIREQKQLDVPLDAFRLEQLPAHLLMNFRVLDEHGRQLGLSRNFAQLHSELAPHAAPVIAAVTVDKQERLTEQRHTTWGFGSFVDTREVDRAGQRVTLYNALVDETDAVVLRAFDTRDAAEAAHRAGLRRLFMLALKEQVKYLEKNLPDAQRLGMLFMPFGTQQELHQQILAMAFDKGCLNDPLPVNEAAFIARAKDAKNRLLLIAQELARLIAQVLSEHQALQKCLPQIKSSAQASADIRAQLEWLLPKRFVADTPYERLQHVPRYLKAINLRIEKLRSNPARDAQCMTQLQPLLQALQKQTKQGKPDPRFVEFAWLLQELRVSLFAQELKTPVIVSVKRLEKMLLAMK
ncbi:ATP-dependent RNA helicase HrpA [Gallionella capsiferriformans]|uniref:ATP-dependent helicase HrpA n=1 Tax=Gallionella capsiferriformans (strain ES-2) TaxID=395494 RepID=D9SCL5_GALCS|nr:ATP-dependent RNA helicase HrpA [Gallionella capsiferriformans]ADL56596.1 ATP-dependent helicase HrpA [Gallionella capsiferriformans ES-2]